MAPVLSPVHTPVQTSCVTLKTDLVSVDGQDGSTHKEVKGVIMLCMSAVYVIHTESHDTHNEGLRTRVG